MTAVYAGTGYLFTQKSNGAALAVGTVRQARQWPECDEEPDAVAGVDRSLELSERAPDERRSRPAAPDYGCWAPAGGR